MARYHDRHVPWQRIQPGFKLTNPGEVQMVGRLVEQQHIGLGHHDAGKHGKPLPAAAQLLQRPLPQRLGHLKQFQGNVDPPAFTCPSFEGKHVEHRRIERRIRERGRYILLDIADGQPSRSGDLAIAWLRHACNAAQ